MGQTYCGAEDGLIPQSLNGEEMIVVLVACMYVQPIYVGCKGQIAWCNQDGCVITDLVCRITQTGNIFLPKECFK